MVDFIAQILTLFAVGMILDTILYDLPGGSLRFTRFIDDIRDPISIVIPFGIVWGYYGKILREAEKEAELIQKETEQISTTRT